MENLEIEKLAFLKAPEDTPENPAYPNHSDTDIWVNGFTEGYKSGLKNTEAYNMLKCIIEIGKRDMTNPKYDMYFIDAKKIVSK